MIQISLSDLIKAANGLSTSTSSDVAITKDAFHVKIHGLELGIRDTGNPDRSKLNPVEIYWSQEFKIVEHEVVGRKPLTQCTIPDGLWKLTIKFNTLEGTDGDINDTLESIKLMTAGPGKVYDTLFKEGICMYLTKKDIRQVKGTKDYYHSVELNFTEAVAGHTLPSAA